MIDDNGSPIPTKCKCDACLWKLAGAPPRVIRGTDYSGEVYAWMKGDKRSDKETEWIEVIW